MKKRSKASIWFGLFFLVVGIVWISTIYVRCDGYLPWEKPSAVSGQGTLQEQETPDAKDLPIRELLPKRFVVLFWIIACWELAAAILGGAKTPDAVVLATGIGAGCGIECNQPIQRFLEAAGHRYERPKSSWQWYGRTTTAWEISRALKEDYPVFRFEDDRKLLDRIADASIEP